MYLFVLKDLPVQSSCKICPEGYYCNATFGGVVNYATYICPEGYYCPNGTTFAEEFPCPPGTFNNRTGTEKRLVVKISLRDSQIRLCQLVHLSLCLSVCLCVLLFFLHRSGSIEQILMILGRWVGMRKNDASGFLNTR